MIAEAAEEESGYLVGRQYLIEGIPFRLAGPQLYGKPVDQPQDSVAVYHRKSHSLGVVGGKSGWDLLAAKAGSACVNRNCEGHSHDS